MKPLTSQAPALQKAVHGPAVPAGLNAHRTKAVRHHSESLRVHAVLARNTCQKAALPDERVGARNSPKSGINQTVSIVRKRSVRLATHVPAHGLSII
jgi:hypothetical protein